MLAIEQNPQSSTEEEQTEEQEKEDEDDPKLATLLGSKFKRLAIYFQQMTISDISNASHLLSQDWIERTPHPDKILMAAFLRSVHEWKIKRSAKIEAKGKEEEFHIGFRVFSVEGYYNFDCSKAIDNLSWSSFMDLVTHSVGNMSQQRKSQVSGFCFRNWSLVDNDLARILSLMPQVPSCASVGLSSNLIVGKLGKNTFPQSQLFKLCSLPQIQTIDLRYNPIVEDKKLLSELLRCLPSQLLVKIIFLPETELTETSAWFPLVPKRHRHEVVSAHRKYFQQRNSCQ